MKYYKLKFTHEVFLSADDTYVPFDETFFKEHMTYILDISLNTDVETHNLTKISESTTSEVYEVSSNKDLIRRVP